AGTARVMDFGLAQASGAALNPDAGLSGTAMYMAPEQIKGADNGPSADIFSAGLVLYEMLAGRHPIDAEDAISAIYKLANEPIPALSACAPELAGPWDTILARTLAASPNERFDSARAVRQAIEDVLHAQDDPDDDDAASNSTFRFLLRRMRRRQDFPTISEKILEISRKTASPDCTSVNELANAILNDYALTTKLLKLVNSSFYGQYGGRISTISRAVVILGFKQIRTAAQSLVLFEHLGNGNQSASLREATSVAQMGGIVAQTLARSVGAKEPEEAFVCGMFRSLGKFLTVYYLPEEYADIGRAMVAQGSEEDEACRAVLGLSYDALGVGVAREWQLPEGIIDALRALPAGVIDAEASGPASLRTVAGFSHELADVLSDNTASFDKTRERISALQTRFASALPVAGDDLRELISNAMDAARSYGPILNEGLAVSGAFRSIERWLSGADDPLAPLQSMPPGATQTAPPTRDTDEVLDTPDTVLCGIQDITNALMEGCNVNDVLVMVLETLYRGLSFTRVMLCIRDQRHGVMSARFGLGKEFDEIKPRFRFPLRGNDVFSKAVMTGTDLTYLRAAKASIELPPWYRKLVTPSLAVALPIIVNKVCVGLIYCDREDADASLSANHRSYLNTLRNQAALAVKHSA
ncbi:MAG: HD-like signal output (HDOD) protein, partial [Gammaproteobacteria bacterium]